MSQANRKITLDIEGMTCTGCEARIDNALRKLEGVTEVGVDYTIGSAEVTFDESIISLDKIIDTLAKLDYQVINKKLTQKPEEQISNEPEAVPIASKTNVGQLIGIGIIILSLYLIINNTIGFNFIPEINQSMGFGLLFVVGLLTSLHCVAMCGGINLSVCIQYKTEESSKKSEKLIPSALYNLGRVVSYTLVGGIVGALGSVVSFNGTVKGIIAFISGVFMVIMGLNMLNIFPWLRKFNPRLPRFLGTKIHANKSNKGPFIVGLLNGLMPCGPLQAMQIYALGTGNFAMGALSMFLFSLGTVPLMFGFGAVSSILSGKLTHKLMKISAALVIFLGIVMLNRGLNLSGFGITLSSAQEGESNIAKIQDGIQYVSTELEPGGYSPIIVQKGIPVKWTIKVEKDDLNGCNNPVTIPQYNKQIELKTGDNLIEFTPEKEGSFIYTCWMGMISSRIKVVEDISKVSDEDVQKETEPDDSDSNKAVVPGIPTDKLAISEIKEGVQYVSIDVNENEYSPAVVVMQRSVKTVWIINGTELNDHNFQILFPEYKAGLVLEEGENTLELIPEFDFSFTCTLGTMNGFVKVVDDISNIDIDEIKEEAENFKPAFNFGGGGASCH